MSETATYVVGVTLLLFVLSPVLIPAFITGFTPFWPGGGNPRPLRRVNDVERCCAPTPAPLQQLVASRPKLQPGDAAHTAKCAGCGPKLRYSMSDFCYRATLDPRDRPAVAWGWHQPPLDASLRAAYQPAVILLMEGCAMNARGGR